MPACLMWCFVEREAKERRGDEEGCSWFAYIQKIYLEFTVHRRRLVRFMIVIGWEISLPVPKIDFASLSHHSKSPFSPEKEYRL